MGNGASVKAGNKDGRTFEKVFTLEKELGAGAFSVVKLAINKETNERVAAKIISKKKLSEDDMLSLKSEVEILAALDHPHIIKLYETFDEGSEIYIITELVEGGELFDRIVAKTNYTEKEARDLIKLLLETMNYMHKAGIVHRDLKPENLLLCSPTNDYDIKVADFGFAKKVSELLPKEVACGTPGYVAPEVLRGDAYGSEVDIWSLGVICYVLLAGYPPFYDEDQRALFRKIKEAKYYFHDEYWAETSKEAIDMIKKMICLKQKDRWTAEQLLSHPWITLDDDILEAKKLDSSVEQLRKFQRLKRLRAATNAIILTNKLRLLSVSVKGDNESSPQKSDAVVSTEENADATVAVATVLSPPNFDHSLEKAEKDKESEKVKTAA